MTDSADIEDRLRRIEDRLRRIEDRWAIEELVTSHGVLIDNRDYEAIGELYTEDGHVVGTAAGAEGHTRQGVIDFYREGMSPQGPTYHYHHGIIITFEGDYNARGLITAHAEVGLNDQMILLGYRSHDTFRKGDDGKWRYSKHVNQFHYIMPANELAARYCTEMRRRLPGEPMRAEIPDGISSFQRARRAPYTVVD